MKGLRLFGQVGHAAAFGVVVLIWLVEIGVTQLWSRYFTMGVGPKKYVLL
jgi:uncharacterized membrane protein YeiB